MIAGLPPFRAANEYLIFQKILNLNFEFPDGFLEPAEDLVKKCLIIDPEERLGGQDRVNGTCTSKGYLSIKNHSFYEPLSQKWEFLVNMTPPRVLPYLPGTSENEELRSEYMPEDIEPGLADKQLTRLLGLALCDDSDIRSRKKNILDISSEEMRERLKKQEETSIWHKFVDNNLILKEGFVDKRKGLFSRRRMLLLTTGPHLYYIDASSMILKGEIPWSG